MVHRPDFAPVWPSKPEEQRMLSGIPPSIYPCRATSQRFSPIPGNRTPCKSCGQFRYCRQVFEEGLAATIFGDTSNRGIRPSSPPNQACFFHRPKCRRMLRSLPNSGLEMVLSVSSLPPSLRLCASRILLATLNYHRPTPAQSQGECCRSSASGSLGKQSASVGSWRRGSKGAREQESKQGKSESKQQRAKMKGLNGDNHISAPVVYPGRS